MDNFATFNLIYLDFELKKIVIQNAWATIAQLVGYRLAGRKFSGLFPG